MKKIITVAFAIFFSFSNLAYAEMRYGISGALTMVDATGTETEGGEQNSAEVSNIVAIPSIFAEYSFGTGFICASFAHMLSGTSALDWLGLRGWELPRGC